MQRVNEILSERMIQAATLVTIEGAAHFMIATHADEVARLVAQHAHRAEAMPAAVVGYEMACLKSFIFSIGHDSCPLCMNDHRLKAMVSAPG